MAVSEAGIDFAFYRWFSIDMIVVDISVDSSNLVREYDHIINLSHGKQCTAVNISQEHSTNPFVYDHFYVAA